MRTREIVGVPRKFRGTKARRFPRRRSAHSKFSDVLLVPNSWIEVVLARSTSLKIAPKPVVSPGVDVPGRECDIEDVAADRREQSLRRKGREGRRVGGVDIAEIGRSRLTRARVGCRATDFKASPRSAEDGPARRVHVEEVCQARLAPRDGGTSQLISSARHRNSRWRLPQYRRRDRRGRRRERRGGSAGATFDSLRSRGYRYGRTRGKQRKQAPVDVASDPPLRGKAASGRRLTSNPPPGRSEAKTMADGRDFRQPRSPLSGAGAGAACGGAGQ